MNKLPLEELFDEACKFGRPRVSKMKDGKWCATIEFSTIQHVELEAKSGYDCIGARDAIEKAIISAVKIVESMRTQMPSNTESVQEKL